MVILVHKKDGIWRMSMDDAKYRHLIPHLDDMLDELYSACVYSRMDLKKWISSNLYQRG